MISIKRRFIIDPSLVLYLPLYEPDGAALESGDAYGHAGTVTGALWRPNGRYFDGVDDKINLPDTPPLSPASQITLEAWFNPARTSPAGRILSKFPGDYKGWSMYSHTRLDCQLYTTTGLGGAASAEGVIAAESWHHGAFTYDGAYIRIYVNGNLSGAPAAKTGSIVYTALAPAIGADNGAGAAQPFKGIIGEARIYSRALNLLEIRQNYEATKWRYQ